jgi:two-component system OmpR family sensor kinase
MGRLFARIYLHFLGVLLVVAVASSFVFAWTARGAFVQESSGRISRHISSLAGEVFRDPPALARRVRQLHDELDLDLVARDLQGRVVASAGKELPTFTPEQLAQVRTGLRMVQPNPEWSVAIPIRDPQTGAVVGTVETSAHRRSRLRGLSRPALILSLLLVMFAFPAAILARRISRPVERLTEAARRLGAGDLTARVPPGKVGRWWRRDPSGDELADLTRAFNDMAERIERLIAGQKELMANISHELRSPLTRIRVALELLPRNGATQARLADVETDLDELERLIEDVLTASRLEATGLPPHPELVEAQQLLEDLVERARLDPRLGPDSVRIAPGSPVELEADPALLRRALWNLVDNAAKYGAPPVALSAQRHNGSVELSVSDEGPGIPQEERERVLAPFYQMDRARTPGRPARGFGLGLTLASRVAQVHHGNITIGPAETINGAERGCRVTLTLPASPAA